MTTTAAGEITDLLHDMARGDTQAEMRLFGRTYPQLLGLARSFMRREPRDAGITETSLAHDAHIRLTEDGPRSYRNRRHFFGCYRRAMWRICVEAARKRRALKNGAGRLPLPLHDEVLDGRVPKLDEILTIHESLERLERVLPRAARVVWLRFIDGWTEEEIADELKVCRGTVQHDWRLARAWLRRELAEMGLPRALCCGEFAASKNRLVFSVLADPRIPHE